MPSDGALRKPPYVARALVLSAGLGLLGAFLGTGIVRCPTAALLHVPCPACGTTRSARALFSGDLVGALRIHPVAPLVIVVFGTLAARAIWLVLRQGHSRELLEGRLGRLLVVLIVLCSGAELVLWVLRWFGMFGGPVPV